MACSDDDNNKKGIGYLGKDMSDKVEIVRDAETKNAVLNVKTDLAANLRKTTISKIRVS